MSFPVIAFDGFPEMIDRLSRTDENSAKMLLDILMKWTAHTSRYAHIVFIGQNPFGEDIIRTRTPTHNNLFTFSFFTDYSFFFFLKILKFEKEKCYR